MVSRQLIRPTEGITFSMRVLMLASVESWLQRSWVIVKVPLMIGGAGRDSELMIASIEANSELLTSRPIAMDSSPLCASHGSCSGLGADSKAPSSAIFFFVVSIAASMPPVVFVISSK